MRRRLGPLGIPELFLGLLSIAVAAVLTAHTVAGTIHDARHTRDTVTVTGSARKPISADLVQWSLSVQATSAEAGLGHLGALLLIVGCLAFVGTLMGEAVYDRVGRRSTHRG